MFYGFQFSFAPVVVSIIRFGTAILALGILLVSGPGLDSPVLAQDPEDGEIQAFLKNTGFENGLVNPWLKKPNDAQGAFWAECDVGHSAVGNCNAGLAPFQAGDIIMQQAVASSSSEVQSSSPCEYRWWCYRST